MKPAVEWISRPSRPSDDLPLQSGDEVVGQRHALERRSEDELARVEDERLVVRHLDELRELLLLGLDVDERVARVPEHAEQAVAADVEARRLHETGVVGVDADPARLDQPPDGAVGEHHRRGS